MDDPGFFVGYHDKVPRPLAWFNLGCGLALAMLFALVALSLGRGIDAAAEGAVFGGGETTVEGVVQITPYPMLRTTAGNAVLLAGEGKRGAMAMARDHDGRTVKASGYLLKRGTLDMLVTGGMSALPGNAQPPGRQSLGRWRVGGEICDGKCAAGIMHPGTGLAHKACANLCLSGGVPPVLAFAQPVEGDSFALLADGDGLEVPAAAFDLTGLPVELEGALERRGNMLVFRVNWAKARRL